jgi:polyketide cyclase/dehydrase/lipid transport protein
MQKVEAHAHSAADRESVWRVVADAPGWSRWGAWSKSDLQREGDPPPGGVGAIKALTSQTRRPVVSVEEVTAFEPPTRFGYKLLSGLPLRNYEAEITLAEAPGGGTDITWRSRFDPKFPLTGGLFRRALQKFTDDAARRLAGEAERTAGLQA